MKCTECGKEFEAGRSDARFCSTSCKLKAYRAQSKTATEKLAEFIPDEPENDEVAKIQRGQVLTTGEYTVPVTNPENWTRPKYWQRLRDLPQQDAQSFHGWLKAQKRRCPTDPTLPSSEQDFYHPWAYSEFKNPSTELPS